MITGSIESVRRLQDGRILVAAWARHSSANGGRPVDKFTVFGRDDIAITVTEREINGTPGCGCTFVLGSADDLAALHWGAIALKAEACGETLVLKIWDQIKNNILRLIAEFLVDQQFGKAKSVALLEDWKRESDQRQLEKLIVSQTASPYLENIIVNRGATTRDFEVTIGNEGFLFLLGGSNGVMKQYNAAEDPKTLDRWLALFRSRQKYLSENGAQYIQLIVPEKQSVIFEYFPLPIKAPTPLLSSINNLISSENYYIDCYKILRDNFVNDGLEPFRKVDSHLSYFGAEAIVRDILKITGVEISVNSKILYSKVMRGDLGNKFFVGEILERVILPSDEWDFSLEVPEVLRADYPKEGLSGTIIEWRARSPRSPKTILIFGNSMFERGGGPLGLSWWLSRIFARTCFIWSAKISEDYVASLKPDVVICQTVERFLTHVPPS